jgi:biopolymer transport protein ExbD
VKQTPNLTTIIKLLYTMKKYTITVLGILGTLALIYFIVVVVNNFRLINMLKKPIVTQIHIPEGGKQTAVLEKYVIEITLTGNHEFTYKTIKSKPSNLLPIDSQVFIKEVSPLIQQIGKDNVVISLYLSDAEKYKDIVDMLDLFTQNDIKKYAILKDNERK